MAEKTFGERADDYANSVDDQPWFEARHARLSELLTAFWLGEFEDEHGNSRLTLSSDSYGSSPHPCSRDFLFGILPTGSAGMPKEIRYHDPRARPYHAFAAMQARQYLPGCFVVERIEINDDDYQRFLRHHHKAVINQNQKEAHASPSTRQTTSGAEVACKKWLQAQVEEWSKENGPVPKRDDLLAQAQKKFPKLSQRGFIYRVWPETVPVEWKRSGPKS